MRNVLKKLGRLFSLLVCQDGRNWDAKTKESLLCLGRIETELFIQEHYY